VASMAFRPAKELKAFAKVDLQPGEETEVTLDLDRRAFAWYDPQRKEWRVEAGTFEILVGASSQDIRLNAAIEMPGAQPAAERVEPDVYHAFPKGAAVSQKDFEALLGCAVPLNQEARKGQYTFNTPIGDMHESFIGRQFAGMIKKQLHKMIEGKEDTPMALLMEATAQEMPLRGMLMGDTPLNREMLEALLLMMNGRFFRGLFALVHAIVRR